MNNQIIITMANGQTMVLSPGDRITNEITVTCESKRCPSRHRQDKPVEFTFNDASAPPPEGDEFMTVTFPERSPSYPGRVRAFCGPNCLKDYLTYEYIAPPPRNPEPVVETPGPHINLPATEAVGQADGDPGDTHGA